MECKNIYVFEENFYYTQESERKTNEQLPVNIESSASLNEEDKKIKIEMIITIGSKESPNYDFFYNIRLVGIFNGLIEDYNEKSIKD